MLSVMPSPGKGTTNRASQKQWLHASSLEPRYASSGSRSMSEVLGEIPVALGHEIMRTWKRLKVLLKMSKLTSLSKIGGIWPVAPARTSTAASNLAHPLADVEGPLFVLAASAAWALKARVAEVSRSKKI